MTGNQPVYDFKQLVTTADLFRNLGFSIAMDDLGEGLLQATFMVGTASRIRGKSIGISSTASARIR